MTIIALILSILLGTISLAIGYIQGGLADYSLWFLLLAAVWLVTHFRKWYWFSSIALLVVILAAAFLTLRMNKGAFDNKVYGYLFFSILITIVQEICFTSYVSNYGFTNLLGHYCKIAAFYLIYRAIIRTGIRDPYDLIFREASPEPSSLLFMPLWEAMGFFHTSITSTLVDLGLNPEL
jgi:hypothetical protein